MFYCIGTQQSASDSSSDSTGLLVWYSSLHYCMLTVVTSQPRTHSFGSVIHQKQHGHRFQFSNRTKPFSLQYTVPRSIHCEVEIICFKQIARQHSWHDVSNTDIQGHATDWDEMKLAAIVFTVVLIDAATTASWSRIQLSNRDGDLGSWEPVKRALHTSMVIQHLERRLPIPNTTMQDVCSLHVRIRRRSHKRGNGRRIQPHVIICVRSRPAAVLPASEMAIRLRERKCRVITSDLTMLVMSLEWMSGRKWPRIRSVGVRITRGSLTVKATLWLTRRGLTWRGNNCDSGGLVVIGCYDSGWADWIWVSNFRCCCDTAMHTRVAVSCPWHEQANMNTVSIW